MIRMIFGWTMVELGRNHSVHLIREMIIPDDTLLPKLMKGEVTVKLRARYRSKEANHEQSNAKCKSS